MPGVALAKWARERHGWVEEKLLKHGSLLFRGFGIRDVSGFHQCVAGLTEGALPYLFRASPRSQVDSRFSIYTSTDYPAAESIFPHNEHSYSPIFPRKILFFCELPAQIGGETPLGDGRSLLRHIDPAVREQFVRRGIRYVRNFGDGFGLPWQTVFQSEDASEVEAYCRSVGISVQWKGKGRLRTHQMGPAVVAHPGSGEPLWFNHAAFFNALTLPSRIRESLLKEYAPEDLPQNTFYGDGSLIESSVIEHLQAAYRKAMVDFTWQQGDVLLLDNMLSLHARKPFGGPRRVLTAMAEACQSKSLRVLAPGEVENQA